MSEIDKLEGLRQLKEKYSLKRVPLKCFDHCSYAEVIAISREFLKDEDSMELICGLEILSKSKSRGVAHQYLMSCYKKSLVSKLVKLQIRASISDLKEMFPTADWEGKR